MKIDHKAKYTLNNREYSLHTGNLKFKIVFIQSIVYHGNSLPIVVHVCVRKNFRTTEIITIILPRSYLPNISTLFLFVKSTYFANKRGDEKFSIFLF